MTDRVTRRHIEIKDGDRTVAVADVSTPADGGAAPRAALHAASGHIVPGSRARLVDCVLDLPEVRDGGRLEASVPIGDGESLDRFRERCADVSTRAAGSSALLDATPAPSRSVPPDPHDQVPG
jgi:hypothetical protein